MALISCPECGQQVSKQAAACPSCGYGIAKAAENKAKKAGCSFFALCAGIVILAAMFGGKSPDPEEAAKVKDGDVTKAREQTPLIGETWYVSGEPIGCRDSADLDRLGDLARQNDPAAFSSFYLRQSIAGRCTKLADGTQVYVEKVSIFTSPCVRPKGDPFCLYVLTHFLKKNQGDSG